MTLGKIKPRFKLKKLYFLTYLKDSKKLKISSSNLKLIRKEGLKQMKKGSFISLVNNNGVFLSC